MFERCPHRLGAQDTALSRRRRGFESPWGRSEKKGVSETELPFLFLGENVYRYS